MQWRPLTQKEIEDVLRQAIDTDGPLDLTTDIDQTVYDRENESTRDD